ncbi:MAG: hypothetical protein WBQ94_30935 [Terracidiphilus sp.]
MKTNRLFMIAAAAVLAFAAASANVHAQTVGLGIAGSSAQFQEAGQAAAGQLGCLLVTSSKNFTLNDVRGSGSTGVSVADSAAGWVAWVPAVAGNCAGTNAANGSVYYYINTDSVVGNRCFFGSPSCSVAFSGTVTTTCFPGVTCATSLPAGVQSAITSSRVNVAATDIRPEDGEFAMTRALTPCNLTLGTGSQYLGLGQQTANPNQGNPILQAGNTGTWTIGGYNLNTQLSASSFNVAAFNLQGNDPASGAAIANGTGNNWSVISVGAAPELVIVNPTDTNGLGSLSVTNVDRSTLAGFLDGTFGAVQDLVPQLFSSTGEVPVNVVIREPLSGTYNTMEYAIPNNIANQTSQDIGEAALFANNNGLAFPAYYCTGATVGGGKTWASQTAPNNPLQETNSHASVTSTRSRVLGTGNVVKVVEHATDSLGYAFWSQANFSSATPGNAKYITVDGVDPIQEVWSDGEVPTSGNNLLSNVSFSHVKDGSYPIWSILRLVASAVATSCDSATGVHTVSCASLATTLANNEQKFVTPDFPDFVLKDQLSVVRSHFTPPGVVYPGNGGSPSNGDAGSPEAGGDVGGMVYSQQADNDYSADNSTTTGQTGKRQ